MLNLFDYISAENAERIEAYIGAYGIPLSYYIGNDAYLENWAKCKKKLFHLLGGKLVYEAEVNITKNSSIIEQEIKELCTQYIDFIVFIENTLFDIFDRDNEKVDKKCEEKSGYFYIVGDSIRDLFNRARLTENRCCRTLVFYNPNIDKEITFSPNTKLMKVIRKVINFYDIGSKIIPFAPRYTVNDLFEKFRIQHSLIFNEKQIKGTLCLSIDPIDFMTMSDNSYNWSSCMNWTDSGCYHVGTVEMMNSNNVICAYLKGAEPYTWEYDGKTYSCNNKKWRQLFYATKEIIVSGKAYPYTNKELTIKALEILRELARTNWKHIYRYGIEPYKDMKHISSLWRMNINKNWIRHKMTNKHNIIFDTKGMYNDMLNDQYTTYYCIRNKVDKNVIISYSGKCNCLGCRNQVIRYNYEEESYNDRYDNTGNVICEDCRENFVCDICHASNPTRMYQLKNGDKVCSECLEHEIRICPCCGEMFLRFKVSNERDELLWTDGEIEFPEGSTHYFSDIDGKYLKDHRIHVCEKCRKDFLYNHELSIEKVPYSYWSSTANINLVKVPTYLLNEKLQDGNEFNMYFGRGSKMPSIEKINSLKII